MFKVIYENPQLLAIDKPAGIPVWTDSGKEGTIAEQLVKQFPELENLGAAARFGIVHRLDKDTSGILIVAKTRESFEFLQQQFKDRSTEKTYLALVVGIVKDGEGKIETLLGRSPADRRKQKVFPLTDTGTGKREALTLYKVLQRFENFTLLLLSPKTGRKHQLRAHLAALSHPIVGDKLYGFKNQPEPEGLKRQFLHANFLKIKLPSGTTKEFNSFLPEDLQHTLDHLQNISAHDLA